MLKIKNFYLVSALIIAALGLYVGFVFCYYYQNRAAAQSLAVAEHINLVSFHKQRLDEWLGDKQKIVSPAFAAVESLSLASERELIKEILRNIDAMGDFGDIYAGYDDMYLISADETAIANYKVSQRDWYKMALKGLDIAPSYQNAFIKDNIIISLIRAFFLKSAGMRGALSTDLALDKIQNEILKINENLQGFAFLMTKEGSVIASANLKNPSVCPECELAISAIKFGSIEKNLHYYEAEGQNFILFYEPLKNADWIFAMSLDESKIFAPLDKNLRQNIAFALILALFGAAGSYYALRISGYATKQAQIKEQILLQNSKMAAMSEMFTAVTHQWRQPISAIMILTGMIKMRLQSNPSAQKSLKNADEIENIVKFLDQSLSSFKMFYQPQNERKRVNLIEILNEVFLIARPLLQLKGALLEFKFDDGDYEFNSYPNYLKQVFLNLISNAKDAFEKDKKDALIKVTAQKTDGKFIVRVEDNGSGIEPAVRQNLFKELKSTKGERGTGNGLYICKLLLENRLKGCVRVVSYEKPTVFEVVLEGADG